MFRVGTWRDDLFVDGKSMERRYICSGRIYVAGNVGKHKAVFRIPNGNFKGRMVDALARKSDEGRGVATIRFGEVPSNL